MKYFLLIFLGLFLVAGLSPVYGEDAAEVAANNAAEDAESNTVDSSNVPSVEADLGASREGSRTDAEVVDREAEAIKSDELNVAQINELRDKGEKHVFQTEVNRMMKLIINSLYRNKEIFLRELISNASDALDKIRLLSLTNNTELTSNPSLNIKIKADKENKILHIIDSGIGMTKEDLINNLGTIAKSGTADFLSKMQESKVETEANDMIGQFGVGFYSAFLVADRVVVTTKNNAGQQQIWESDASSFSIGEDPRGDTLQRGSQISLFLKDEAQDFLEEETIKNLIKKYSQFINFPIYLWTSKSVEEEVPVEVEKKEEKKSDEDEIEDGEEDAKVEEDTEDDKPKTKKVTKTVWDWEVMNTNKPIWTRKPAEVTKEEYNEFYKSLTKDSTEPLVHTHFVAEGEVTFKALLFVPKVQPSESFNRYGTKSDYIKLYVRRVFITDEFNDMMPNYLSFIRGIVDSDDLPLNVSRETLQQHKLIKVIKKKLVRKVLDMFKKMSKEDYPNFWKEYSTNIKLGVMEDPSNRSRLAKLLRFQSSHGADSKDLTGLEEYVTRMKPKQEHIYWLAGSNREEVQKSPFVERLLARGYEVLYLIEAVDEYSIASLPEFDGKKFQNVAKEGFSLDTSETHKAKVEELKKSFEPLTKWLGDVALKDRITKAVISERLSNSPCALVAGLFGWTGNMERLALSNAHQKSDDPQRTYYLNQKKTLEINPRHPLIKELLRRVESNDADGAKDLAVMMFQTATLRSGYMLQETADFADNIEKMMRQTLGISADEKPEEDEYLAEELAAEEAGKKEGSEKDDAADEDGDSEHDEL